MTETADRLDLTIRHNSTEHSEPPFTPPPAAYTIRRRNYGGGNVEVTASRLIARRPRKGKSGPRSAPTPESAKRSTDRARSSIKRYIMAAGLDHLLTVTIRANLTDEAEAWPLWTRFVRLVREASGQPWHYIVTCETQQRGAIHWHAAVKGRQDVAMLRKAWWAVVGKGNGNIDVQGGRERNMHKVARYIGKYISKQADDRPGRRRYRRSEGIKLPDETCVADAASNDDLVNLAHVAIAEAGGSVQSVAYDRSTGYIDARGKHRHGRYFWVWAASWAVSRKVKVSTYRAGDTLSTIIVDDETGEILAMWDGAYPTEGLDMRPTEAAHA